MIRGKVLCRTRRETKGSDGKALFIITLSILATQGVFVVQRWADVPIPKELPFVGEQVELPIRISAYLQAGVPEVRIVWTDDESSDSF